MADPVCKLLMSVPGGSRHCLVLPRRPSLTRKYAVQPMVLQQEAGYASPTERAAEPWRGAAAGGRGAAAAHGAFDRCRIRTFDIAPQAIGSGFSAFATLATPRQCSLSAVARRPWPLTRTGPPFKEVATKLEDLRGAGNAEPLSSLGGSHSADCLVDCADGVREFLELAKVECGCAGLARRPRVSVEPNPSGSRLRAGGGSQRPRPLAR
jgi:hypothetical protein